jgi:hypothetical protein
MPPEPEPVWLTTKIERRLDVIRDGMMAAARNTGAQFVMTYLDEPDPGATDAERDRWERTCDNCGRYCPPDGEWDFWTGHVVREIDGRQVMIAFGVCAVCRHES